MKTKLIITLASSLLAFSSSVFGQLPPPPDRPGPGPGEIRPPAPEISDAVKALIAEFQAAQDKLRADLRTAMEGLGATATMEQRKAVLDAFREANKEAIAAQKERMESIHEAIKEAREATLSDAAKALIAQIKAAEAELAAANKALREALAKATTEEAKKALVDAFKAEQKSNLEDLAKLRKDFREEVRGKVQDGPRRKE